MSETMRPPHNTDDDGYPVNRPFHGVEPEYVIEDDPAPEPDPDIVTNPHALRLFRVMDEVMEREHQVRSIHKLTGKDSFHIYIGDEQSAPKPEDFIEVRDAHRFVYGLGLMAFGIWKTLSNMGYREDIDNLIQINNKYHKQGV
jgi:hypothetical protein